MISGMKDWHPLLKLLLALCSLVVCLASKDLVVYILILLSMFYFLLGQAKIKPRFLRKLFMAPSMFILLSGVVLLIEISDKASGLLYLNVLSISLCITPESLTRTVYTTLRAYAGVSCLYLICLTIPLHELLNVLRAWRFPGLLTELMYLIYRYLFVLLEALYAMTTSARGRLGYCNYANSLRSMKAIGSTLLLCSFRRSSLCYDGLLARGYDGGAKFWQEEKPFRRNHLVITVVYLFILLLIFLAGRMGIWIVI